MPKSRRQREEEILGPPKTYRLRRGLSDKYEDVTEQEYLNAVARKGKHKAGTLEELGAVVLDEPEKGKDIELRQRKKKK
jgi:hypothetical protein